MHADPRREPRSPGLKELRLIIQWQAKSECGPGFIQGPRLANTRAAPGRGALGNLDSGYLEFHGPPDDAPTGSVSLHRDTTASPDDGSSGVAVELVESAHAAERRQYRPCTRLEPLLGSVGGPRIMRRPSAERSGGPRISDVRVRWWIRPLSVHWAGMLPAADSRDGNPRVYSATLEDWEAPSGLDPRQQPSHAESTKRCVVARTPGDGPHAVTITRTSLVGTLCNRACVRTEDVQ
jgi:hypothetical protein